MSEELVLFGQNVMMMTAKTRDTLLARPDLKMQVARPTPESFVGWELDGVRIEILTEEELREKAKEAKPAPARQERVKDLPLPIARSVPFQHPRALSREATRRRRQAGRRAARAGGATDDAPRAAAAESVDGKPGEAADV